MATTKEQRLSDLHNEAMIEFDRIQAVARDERMQCLEDRRFYSIVGAQWEGPLGEQFENKPRLEFNMTHLAVIRVVNEYRNNRITVDFTPKDGASNSELADVCDGLYRADEQDSGAQEAYDNAFEEGVGGGFGAWWVHSGYEDDDDDDNDRQRVRFDPIFDADSCVFQDKADARRCFVLIGMTYDAFEEQFGHSPVSWPKTIEQRRFDWCTPETVYVAHYYRVEEVSEVIHIFRGLDDTDMRVPHHELIDDPEKLTTLTATGFREVRQKRVKRRRIHKYILSGHKVEEDEGYIAGRCIPVVPYYGKRWYVDGVERCMGHVRLAKDAQRLMNTLMSWLTEIAGRFDVEKPIFTPEQVLGHATRWARDNIDRYPYLLVNAIKDAEGNVMGTQPIGYTKAPNIPPAMAALVQIAQQALNDLLGNQQAGEQMQPNLSGKAVELIQNRLDMQVFIYMSNFAKSMKRCGEIWLSMSKDVVIENGRKMKTVAADGEVGSVEMNVPGYDAKKGEETMDNSLTAASFDVWVDVGPSSSSRRASTVRALTGIASITDDPETKQALTLATLSNLEGEGLGDLHDWARRRGVRMGIIKPTDQEQEEMAAEQAKAAEQPPDANAQFLIASAAKAEADAAKARAETVRTIADAKLKEAQTEQIEAEIPGMQRQEQLATVEALQRVMTSQNLPEGL
jgi:Phage P22-like portal protein